MSIDLNNLPSQLVILKKKIAKAKAYRDLICSQINEGENRVNQLKYNADLHQKSSEIIKSWLEDLLKNNIDSVADLVTNGLNNVIDDQNLKFHINQEC